MYVPFHHVVIEESNEFFTYVLGLVHGADGFHLFQYIDQISSLKKRSDL